LPHVALDLPGHGQSDKPAPDAFDYSVDGMASAVAGAIEAMGLEPAVLVGHSLGGAVATTIALARPGLVRGLVLLDGAGLGSDVNPELLDRVEAEPSPDEARQLLELFYEDKGLIRDRGVEEMYRSRLVPGADEAVRAATRSSFDRDGQRIAIYDRLAELPVPTMIIWGERDRVFPAEQAADAAEKIPDAWLEVLDGVGHVPQVEAPGRVVALLDRFVRALPEPG
jgi:pyruvate dehydrogenase E2 component (dihydrolipoamide acetyltransferase)